MRYQPLPATFHVQNRRKLAKTVGPEAIAVIDTADTLTRTGDFEYPFHPDPNFYYLTGIDEPGAVLVLVPDHPSPQLQEVLFIRDANDRTTLWEGAGLTADQAAKHSGIHTVLPVSELEDIMERLLSTHQSVYLNAPESLASSQSSPAQRRATQYQQKLPLHQFKSALPALALQRTIKHPAEIEQIRAAIAATHAGLQRAWSHLAPGIKEFELEAELGAGFIRAGAQGHGFSPIVAAGQAATTIHYMSNDATVGAQDLVLFDVGAEVGWYSADISRTVPATGQFTKRQRAVYDAVYRTQQAAFKLHKPGASILEIDAAMRTLLIQELVGLELISDSEAKSPEAQKHLSQYYPHISHHLGLDVHDTGSARLAFKPGMVVTCEPGLYIKEEGIGVRLEDDILITETGHEVLSHAIAYLQN
jgi:Xaa-Pro aminopeptidase